MPVDFEPSTNHMLAEHYTPPLDSYAPTYTAYHSLIARTRPKSHGDHFPSGCHRQPSLDLQHPEPDARFKIDSPASSTATVQPDSHYPYNSMFDGRHLLTSIVIRQRLQPTHLLPTTSMRSSRQNASATTLPNVRDNGGQSRINVAVVRIAPFPHSAFQSPIMAAHAIPVLS